ncbi:MAG: VanW family protein [Candidatus Roizmanbacteria bacterium]
MISKYLKKRLSILQYCSIIVVLLTLLLTVFYLSLLQKDKELINRFYPNVYIDNINVGQSLKSDLVDKYKKKTKEFANTQINIFYNNQAVATVSGQIYNIHSDGDEIIENAYMIGRSSSSFHSLLQKILSIYNIQKYDFKTRIGYDTIKLINLLTSLEDQYTIPAKNALFSFENGKVTTFRKDEQGKKINTLALKNQIDEFIRKLHNSQDISLNLTSTPIQPDIQLSQSNEFGIEELIATGESNYRGSMPERIHNVILGASKFHGVLIPKDKIFSFDEIVGDISSLTGFKPAYVIKSGKTVLGDGGGICQVSTTMFRTAMNAGLPILERNAHAYRVSYYENDTKPGFDATIFTPSVDLKFKNNTPGSILIQTEVDEKNTKLKFLFYGKKDNRKVEITDIRLYDQVAPPPPSYQEDPSLQKGVQHQIEHEAWGATASFIYKVFLNENTNLEQKFISRYQPWQAVYMVGTKE